MELSKASLESPTLFGIYINKLEGCLEEAGCADTILVGIVIILLLYVDDIVLMEKYPFDLDKQLRIIKDFCSCMGMTVNTDQTKVIIIKSKKVTYANFCTTISIWKKCLLINILELIFIISSIGSITLRKKINGEWKAYFGLESNCKSTNLVISDKNKFIFETLVTLVIFYGCEVWGCSVSR